MTKHQKVQVNFAKIGLSGPPKKIEEPRHCNHQERHNNVIRHNLE